MVKINSNAAPVLFQSVTKVYGKDVVAVDDINLEIKAGKLVTLLGPSGCGKTTTLRMIAGLEMATQGKILIGDRDVTQLPATDRDVSMVFQSYALFPHMSVLENVSYGLNFSGFGKSEAFDRAVTGLDLVGLKGSEIDCQASCRGGSSSALPLHEPWCWNHKFCCSMNRCQIWMLNCAGRCVKKFEKSSKNLG